MERNEILSALQNIFREVIDNDKIELTFDSSADDIEEWDSLTHIQLVVAIKKAFNINLTSLEILRWRNVGEIVSDISNKLK